MAKVNEDLKKQVEKFNKSVEDVKRQKVKSEKFEPLKPEQTNTEVNRMANNYKSYMNGYKVRDIDRSSGVSDNGFNQDALDNNTILYNSDTNNNAPKKMRRIVSSKSDDYNTLNYQQKTMGRMFGNQAKLMTRFHSEKMAFNTKYQNSMLEYTKNISEQVTQMNKIKNSIQIDFYKNSLTTQSSILEELKSINKTLKTGFNLNDKGERVYNRETQSLIRDLFSGGNFRGKAKDILKSLGNDGLSFATGGMSSMMSMALGMLPMILQMGGPKMLLSMGAKMGIGSGVEKLLGNSRQGILAKKMMEDPGEFFENMMTSWGLRDKGIKGWLGKRLGRKDGGINKDFDISRVLNKDFKGKANFDYMAHTALTKVITRSLANIESVFSGKPAMYYNYATNKFETLEEGKEAMKGSSKSAMEEIEKLTKSITKGEKIKVKSRVGGKEYEKFELGAWDTLLKMKNDLQDSNLDYIQKAIRAKGDDIANAFVKLVTFLARNDSDPAELLNEDLPVKVVVKALFGNKINDKTPDSVYNKYMEQAFQFKIFLDALKSLNSKEGKKVYQTLLGKANRLYDTIVKETDLAFKSAEGSVAQWSAYNYGEIIDEQKKRMRGKTRHELDEEFKDIRKEYDFMKLEKMNIDLTGVANEEQLKVRLTEEYNKMMQPLFMGTTDKIRNNLKAKARQLKKQNHVFAKYAEDLSRAFEKAGSKVFDDYRQDISISSIAELRAKTEGPKFNGYDHKTAIESAKNIAKWHMENNPKARGLINTGAAVGYTALVKQMFQSTGMVGPMGSAIIGIGAAASAILSGKMGKVTEIMTTSLGDEKMLDKNGNETNVTRRQVLMEATYKEMLPKAWGYRQGAKFGAWIKNNIRFGPILGPVIGLSTGFLLSKASSFVVKVAGLFGKMGKGLLNSLGRTLSGDENMSWGDSLRDLIRSKFGLGPVNDFTSKDVFDQTIDKKKSKTDRFFDFFTGRNVRPSKDPVKAAVDNANGETSDEKKEDVQDRYYRMRQEYYASKKSKVEEGPKEKIKTVEDSVKATLASTLAIRVVGGHLDAIGTIGALDAETYRSKLQNLAKTAGVTAQKSVAPDTPKAVVDNMKKVINTNVGQSINFTKSDNEMKKETKEQDVQEEIEKENRDNLEKIAKGGGGKEKVKKPKKKGGLLALGLAALLFGKDAVDIGKKWIPKIFGGLFKSLPKFLGGLTKWLIDLINPFKAPKRVAKGAKKAFDIFSGFYQKDADGKVSKDGKISAAMDIFKFFRDPVGRGLAKGVGKTAFGVAKGVYKKTIGKTAIPKGAKWMAKGFARTAKFAKTYFGLKMSERLAIKVVGDTAEKAATKGVENAAKEILKQAKNTKEIGKIAYWALKALDSLENLLFKIPGVKKFAAKIANKFVPMCKKIVQELIEKISGKLGKKAGESAAKKGFIGTVKGLLTAGTVTAVLNLGFIAWDSWQGAKKAKDFFKIKEGDVPTTLQTWACAITYGILSLIECIPGCMIITSIVSAIDGIMKWLCYAIYIALDKCLDTFGAGDDEKQAERMKTLMGLDGELPKTVKEDENGNIDFGYGATAEGKPISTELAKKLNDAQLKMREEGRTEDEIKREMSRLIKEGGSGVTQYHGSIEGNPVKNEASAPTFYSQKKFPDINIGGLSTQKDGCALAVLKMLLNAKGQNIDDATLMTKMNQHILNNKSVSIDIFRDFGGKLTSNKKVVKSALKSGSCLMALLIRNKGFNHFVAVISKDSKTVYMGDPLKDRWETISANSPAFLNNFIAAAIFSGTITSNLSVKNITKKGGRGVGGFGKNAKPIDHFFGIKNNARKAARGAIMNIFNNGSSFGDGEYEQSGVGDTSTGGTVSSNGGFQNGVVAMPHGPVVAVMPGGGAQDNIVKYQDGTIAKRHGTVGFRNFNPDSHKKGSSWAKTKFGAMDSPNGAYVTYPSPDHASAAMKYMIFEKKDGTVWYNKTIKSFVDLYLGGSAGGNVSSYLNYVTKYSGKGPDTVLSTLNEQERTGLLRGVRMAEIGVDTDDKLKAFYQGTGSNKETVMEQGTGKAGGNGLKSINTDPLFWGRGSFNIDRAIVNTMHTQAKHVEDSYKWSKDKMCGMAAALFVLKLAYHHLWQKFTPNEIKAWGERTKGAFSKDYGVNQNFFIALGMRPIDIGKVYKDTIGRGKQGEAGKIDGWPFVSLGIFTSGPNCIQPGEVMVVNTVDGHWMTIARAKDGKIYLSNPDEHGPRVIGKGDSNRVRFALNAVDPNQIRNILDRSSSSTGGNKNSNSTTNTNGNNGNNNTTTDGTTTTDANGDANNSGSGDAGTPNKGTSAALGGWFWKDSEGNINQVFFGTKTKKVRSSGGGNNGSGNNGGGPTITSNVEGAAFPNMKDTLSLPIVPALKLKNGDKPFEAAKNCVKNKKGDHYIDPGECKDYVAKALHQAGYPSTVFGTWRQGSQDRAAGRGIPDGPDSKIDQQIGLPPDFGFTMISVQSPPQPGDVAIIWPFGKHRSGHVEMYCGPEAGAKQSGWVSDFDQRRNTPYSESNPNNGYGRRITLYRDSNFLANKKGMSAGSSNTNTTKTTVTTTNTNSNNGKKQGKGDGGDDGVGIIVSGFNGPTKLSSSGSGTASNYYSKGSTSYNTESVVNRTANQLYTKKADGKGPGVHEPGIEVSKDGEEKKPIRQLRILPPDPDRNRSLAMRDLNAKAKYNREMRKLDEDRHYKNFGFMKVSYASKDDVISRTVSTLSGYVQNKHAKNPLVDALLKLTGSLADNVVQRKIGTKKLLAADEQYTEVLDIHKDANKMAKNSIIKNNNNQEIINNTRVSNFWMKPEDAVAEHFINYFQSHTIDTGSQENSSNLIK